MKIVSFFAGAGGLDLGFENAGFDVIWANEFDKDIWNTYSKNHPNTYLDRRSIVDIPSNEVPDCDGIIGGPPCQSWSEAGAKKGLSDRRGQLFFEFIRILADKKPKFFLAENVSGMLLNTHKEALNNIKQMFKDIGYTLSFQMLNVSDYGVPQDRKRVFFIGFRTDLGIEYKFPKPTTKDVKVTLADAIGDLKNTVIAAKEGNITNGKNCAISNHEFMVGGFSSMYMSRNRVRAWDEVSFTIQAGGRHAPLHPQAPKMDFIEQNIREFRKGQEHLYRRLSVRECARVQTFPDTFVFDYKYVVAGYKMIGNAVPVKMAEILAKGIFKQIKNALPLEDENFTKARIHNHLNGQAVKDKVSKIMEEISA